MTLDCGVRASLCPTAGVTRVSAGVRLDRSGVASNFESASKVEARICGVRLACKLGEIKVCRQSGRGVIEVSGVRVVPALPLIAEPVSMRGWQEGVSYNELPHIISRTLPEVASAPRGSRQHSRR